MNQGAETRLSFSPCFYTLVVIVFLHENIYIFKLLISLLKTFVDFAPNNDTLLVTSIINSVLSYWTA